MYRLVFILCSSLFLVACDSGAPVAEIAVSPTPSNVSLSLTKGPISDASCNLLDLDGTQVAGPELSVNGTVTFNAVESSGQFSIVCEGGRYTDEATGQLVDATGLILRSFVSFAAGEDVDAAVTPLTELAYRLAETDGDIRDFVVQAELVARSFGLEGTDIVATRPTDTNTNTIDAMTEEGAYGLVLASLSQLTENRGEGADAASVDKLVEEFTSNLVNDSEIVEARSELIVALRDLATSNLGAGVNITEGDTAFVRDILVTRDETAPTGYSISSLALTGSGATTGFQAQIAAAEAGAVLIYALVGSGGESLTGEQLLTSRTPMISIASLASLADGNLTFSAQLRDAAGNLGAGITGTIEDSDTDGLTDLAEVRTLGTNPTLADSDLDNIADGVENTAGSDPLDLCSPNTLDDSCDTDSDGLTNAEERDLGTDAALVDSDFDGISDSDENIAGNDPSDPCSPVMTNSRCDTNTGSNDGEVGDGSNEDAITLVLTSAESSHRIIVGDQTLNITVPAGSVAENTEISIGQLPSAAADEVFTDPSMVMQALDLQPAGLTFDQPLQFSLDLPLTSDSSGSPVVVGFLETSSQIETLGNLVISSDPEGQTQVTFDVPHFSRVFISELGLTSQFDAPDRVFVGTRANTMFSLTRVTDPNFGVSLGLLSVLAEVEIEASGGPIIVVSEGSFSSDIPSLQQGETTSSPGVFECSDAGRFILVADLEIGVEVRPAFFLGLISVNSIVKIRRSQVGLCEDLGDDETGDGDEPDVTDGVLFPAEELVFNITAPDFLPVGDTETVDLRVDRPDASSFDDFPVEGNLIDALVTTNSSNITFVVTGLSLRSETSLAFSQILSDLFSGSTESSGSIVEFSCDRAGAFSIDVSLFIIPIPSANPGSEPSLATTTVSGVCTTIDSGGDGEEGESGGDTGDPVANPIEEVARLRELNEAIIARIFNYLVPSITVDVFTPNTTASSSNAQNRSSTTTASLLTSDGLLKGIAIADDAGIAVSLVRLPSAERNCITAIDGLSIQDPISEGRYIAEFDCLRSLDGSNTSISVPGSVDFQDASGASIAAATVDNAGLVTEAGAGFTTFNDGRFGEQQLQFQANDQTSMLLTSQAFQDTEMPMAFQPLNEGARPAAFIENADGLDSTLSVDPSNLQEVTTLIFTSDSNIRLIGFVDRRPITPSDTVGERQIMPLVSPELVQYLRDNNIDVGDVTVTLSSSLDVALTGIFAEETAAEASADLVVPAPAVGAGVSLNMSLSTLTREQICPMPDVSAPATRCTAGGRETLLVMNASDEVATYNSVNGEFTGFFLQDVDFSTPEILRAVGIKASQSPDHCVLYADQGGQLRLFDTDGGQIEGDELGTVSANSGNALLTGRAQASKSLEYLGFDFYSEDGATDWKLFVATRLDLNDDGFIDTAQLLRYDYSLTGSAVLSNPVVIATETSASVIFEDVTVVGNLVYVTESRSGEQDPVRVFQASDGAELSPLLTDFVSPRQVSATFDGGLAVVDFPLERIRIVDLQTGTTREEYVLGDGDNRGNDRLRGVAPLRNGDYFVTGLSDVNRAVVNRYTGFFQQVPDNRSSSGVLIGRACLP